MCNKCGKPIPRCGCNEVHPDYCEEGLLQRIPTNTVFYTGYNTPFLQLPKGISLETFIQSMDLVLSNMQNQIDSITPTPSGSVESKSVSLSGDGTSFTFSIPNDFTEPASTVQITPTSPDAQGIQTIAINSQYINIGYEIAPPTGVNNLTFTILKLS